MCLLNYDNDRTMYIAMFTDDAVDTVNIKENILKRHTCFNNIHFIIFVTHTFSFLTHGCCVVAFVSLCDHSHIPIALTIYFNMY